MAACSLNIRIQSRSEALSIRRGPRRSAERLREAQAIERRG